MMASSRHHRHHHHRHRCHCSYPLAFASRTLGNCATRSGLLCPSAFRLCARLPSVHSLALRGGSRRSYPPSPFVWAPGRAGALFFFSHPSLPSWVACGRPSMAVVRSFTPGGLANRTFFVFHDGDDWVGPYWRAAEFPPPKEVTVMGWVPHEGGLSWGVLFSYVQSSVAGYRATRTHWAAGHIGRSLGSFSVQGLGPWPFGPYLCVEDTVRAYRLCRDIRARLRGTIPRQVAVGYMGRPACRWCPHGPGRPASFQCDVCGMDRCEDCIKVMICPRIFDAGLPAEVLHVCARLVGAYRRRCGPHPKWPHGVCTITRSLAFGDEVVDGRIWP